MTRALIASEGAADSGDASLHASFLWAARTSLANAHVIAGTSILWALSLGPMGLALVAGRPELATFAVLPILLATSALHHVIRPLAAGGPFRWRACLAADPVLAALAWAGIVACIALLGAGDAGTVASSLLGAVWILVVPVALAYGAVGGRRGLGALRGGAILALLRPDLALSTAALVVLTAFAVVGTAGALAICLPALAVMFSSRAVAAELARLDR